MNDVNGGYEMLTQEQKETMIAALRGKSVAKENITEEYKKNLDLAERDFRGTGSMLYLYSEKPYQKLPGTYQCTRRRICTPACAER